MTTAVQVQEETNTSPAAGLAALEAKVGEIGAKLDRVLGLLGQARSQRESYSIEEAAVLMGRKPYTVREWARAGRINAQKRLERRGGAELWSVSAAEVERYKDQGLLPPDPARNAGH